MGTCRSKISQEKAFDRYLTIQIMSGSGVSYRRIAKAMGISHSRVEQIINRPPKYIIKRMEVTGLGNLQDRTDILLGLQK